jgi:hypothetical protein
MFVRLRFWWAQRCALTALCTSLEQSPEVWDRVNSCGARKGNLHIRRERDHCSAFWNYYVSVNTSDNGNPTQLPRLWGRRITRAMRKAERLQAYRAALIELKPRNTPLQIKNAKAS